MSTIDFGEEWVRRFDEATARGVPAREVVIAMAADITRLGALAVRAAGLQTNVQILIPKCPNCGAQAEPR